MREQKFLNITTVPTLYMGDSSESKAEGDEVPFDQIIHYEQYLYETGLSNQCINIVKDVILESHHLSRVTSVARGAGFCIYDAKLRELMGIKSHVVSTIPGKGKDIHRLLALLFLKHYHDKDFTDPESLRRKLSELWDRLNVSHQKNSEVIDTAVKLYRGLLTYLPTAAQRLGTTPDKLIPIVEQQFFDTDLHVIGVPDLILEDPEKRVAIVVEWKTDDGGWNTPDKVQVLLYSLMEAKRLGYSENYRGYNTGPEFISAVTGVLENDAVKDVKILPMIIRPSVADSKQFPSFHPLFFSRPNKGAKDLSESYKKMRELIGKSIITAEFLASLIVHPKNIRYTSNDLEDCTTKGGALIFRKALPHLPKGNPTRPSKLCRICPSIEECKFYNFSVRGDLIDRLAYFFRNVIYNIKLDNVIFFEALYRIGSTFDRKKIVETIKRDKGFLYDGRSVKVVSQPRKLMIKLSSLRQRKASLKKLRLDVADFGCVGEDCGNELKRRNIVQNDEEMPEFEGDTLYLFREIAPLPNVRRRKRGEDNSIFTAIVEGKPVSIFLNDGAARLTFSVNLTARVDRTSVIGNYVVYEIGIPSMAFKAQYEIFKEYVRMRPELTVGTVMAETGVDLTGIELMAVDAMQRILNTYEGSDVDKETKKRLQSDLDSGYEEVLNLWAYGEPISEEIGHLLAGHRSNKGGYGP